jgi:hypothetical protein
MEVGLLGGAKPECKRLAIVVIQTNKLVETQ